jgi:hypothetical protein
MIARYAVESGFDCPLDLITTPELYDLRDRCTKEKWPRFADKMISALSSMFTQAVKRRKIPTNPCFGMDKAHKADPNSNRTNRTPCRSPCGSRPRS